MSLTVTEANAVVDLLHWLADKHSDYIGPEITEADAIEAMELLAAVAGRRLQVPPDAKLPALIVERLSAADSDGAAQAVCRALDTHVRHGGSIPWPSVRKPFAEWFHLHPEAVL